VSNASDADWQVVLTRSELAYVPQAPEEARTFHAIGNHSLFGGYFPLAHSLGYPIPGAIIADATGTVWDKPVTKEVYAKKTFDPRQYNPWPFYFSDLSGLGTSLAQTQGVDLCKLIPE
jgi:hypothetical protein